jgi:hypothetical protein
VDPARTIEESLTSDPGIREQYRHFRDMLRLVEDGRFRSRSGSPGLLSVICDVHSLVRLLRGPGTVAPGQNCNPLGT